MLVPMEQPFAAPDPSTQIPSSPPGATSPPPGPRRGRMAAATVAAAGLIGVGVVGVTQLASADDSDASTAEPSQLAAVGAATEETATSDEITSDGDTTSDVGGERGPSIDGEIVIDLGDGDPVTIDLGDLDADALEAFRECVGIPDIDAGELPGAVGDLDLGQIDELLGGLDVDLEEWLDGLDQLELPDVAGRLDGDLFMAPDGTHITVLGPDGVQIIDLGEGDASVTITQNDGQIEITTDGEATVTEPGDLFSDFMDGLPELDGDIDLPGLLEEFPLDLENLPFDLDSLPDLGEFELPAIDLPSADQLQSCLDQLD